MDISNYQSNSSPKREFDSDRSKWSHPIIRLINQEADQETSGLIHWLYSCKGDDEKVGKSALGLWLEQEFRTWLYVPIVNMNVADIAEMIESKRNESGWDQFTEGIHGIYFDIDRDAGEIEGFFGFLGTLGNGILRCLKYDPELISLRHHIHIIVVSSNPPEMVRIDNRNRKKINISPWRMRLYEIMGIDKVIPINVTKFVKYQRDCLDYLHNASQPIPDYYDDEINTQWEKNNYPTP